MHLLLVGSSGLVGSYVLEQALEDSRIKKVTVISRRELPKSHEKLRVEIVDFDHLPVETLWWQADALICTLGTTIKKAGSQEAFKQVDFTYPLEIGKISYKYGVKTYVLNSATGANQDSRFFYNRVKGELENALKKVGFTSLTFVRPGLIGGKRSEFRFGEELGKVISKVLAPLLPRSLRMNHPRIIAKELIEAAVMARPGVHIVNSGKMVGN